MDPVDVADASPLASVRTPCGDASGPVSTGEVDGRREAFLPRHGRANLWLLRSLGVRLLRGPLPIPRNYAVGWLVLAGIVSGSVPVALLVRRRTAKGR